MNTLFDTPQVPIEGEVLQKPAPAMIRLREYQEESMAAIEAGWDREVWRQLLVLATGLGKTTVFSEEIRIELARSGRVLVLAHRDELLEQAAERIRKQNPGVRVGIEAGASKAPYGCQVVVAGVQTLGRATCTRLSWFKPTLIITDEAHHAAADSYMTIYRRYGVFDGHCRHLGVTATPHRMDNKPLHGSERAIFLEVAYSYTLRDGILDGYLADLRGFRVGIELGLDKVKTRAGDYAVNELSRIVNTEEVNHFAVDKWKEVARDRKTIAFCVDVKHAEAQAEAFRQAGISAAHVDGSMNMEHRRHVMDQYRRGEVFVLCNVGIATEGFDDPDTRCVLMLRPTKSWALFVQMIGRGTRTLPGVIDGLPTKEARLDAIRDSGKPDCIVLDIVDLTTRHSAVNLPSVLDLPEGLDLEGETVSKAIKKVESLSESQRGQLFARQLGLSDIDGVLKEVNLLEELKVPEEVAGVSRYSWMKIREGYYILSCGSVEGEKYREGRLSVDTLGLWVLQLKSEKRDEKHEIEGELADVFRAADRLLAQAYPGMGAVSSVNAPWKKLPPSPAQLGTLKRLLRATKRDESILEGITKGEASQMITALMKEAGWDK